MEELMQVQISQEQMDALLTALDYVQSLQMQTIYPLYVLIGAYVASTVAQIVMWFLDRH